MEQAKECVQAETVNVTGKLTALESKFQQHLAECAGRQAAAAEKEAALELACRKARHEACVARYTCNLVPHCVSLSECITCRSAGRGNES